MHALFVEDCCQKKQNLVKVITDGFHLQYTAEMLDREGQCPGLKVHSMCFKSSVKRCRNSAS